MSIGRGRHGREMGPIGYCICLRCRYRVRKIPGVRCLEMKCPKCDAAMIREGFASLYVFGHWFIFSPPRSLWLHPSLRGRSPPTPRQRHINTQYLSSKNINITQHKKYKNIYKHVKPATAHIIISYTRGE